MPPRILITFNFRTGSDKGILKPKSDSFQAVQTALETYVAASTPLNLRVLTLALGSWKLSKQDGKDNWTDSIRKDAVRQLGDWLILESAAQGIFPAVAGQWGDTHNCYAYAMKCQMPDGTGQNSRPGKFAGHAAATQAAFAQGVVDDAAAQTPPLNARIIPGGPTPVPNRLVEAYLVAMVSNQNGYHFMRRDEATGLWTHKNGGASPVENYFYDTTLEQPVAIDDAVAAQILANPALIGCSMNFDTYLRVPKDGLKKVAG